MMICVLLLAALYAFDFEAASRGHSYCRTDFAISHRDPSQVTDEQNVTPNTLAYLPFQGSESTPSVYFFDDYGIFSSFASGNVFTAGRRMMPYYECDFYPLTDNRDEVRLPSAWIGGNRDELRAPRSFRLVFYRKIGGIVR